MIPISMENGTWVIAMSVLDQIIVDSIHLMARVLRRNFNIEFYRRNNPIYRILGSGCDYTTHKSALSDTYDYWTATGKFFDPIDRNYDAYTTDDFVAQ